MNSQTKQDRLPNGAAGAAILSCGIGVSLFGVLVVLTDP